MVDEIERIREVKLGETLSANVCQSMVGRDERESQLIHESLQSRLRDMTSPSCKASTSLSGPFTLTLDQQDNCFTLSLQNAAGEIKTAAIPVKELRSYILNYWKSREAFRDSRLPAGETRARFEIDRHDAHGLGLAKVLEHLSPSGISANRDMAGELFSLLSYVYNDPERANPSADVAVNAGRAR